jgi:undecaprenyl-diphosphatase
MVVVRCRRGDVFDRRVLIGIVVASLVLVVAAVMNAGDATMSIAEALLIGVVEGVTEFLPISSTGHLTVTQELLGLTASADAENAADAYAIVIQAGAIVAVLGIYRHRVANATASIFGRGEDVDAGRRLLAALVGGFVPAAILGLTLSELIKDRLFSVGAVVVAWIVGGIVILLWKRVDGNRPLETLGLTQGFIIGCAQALALWPGTSRSLVTILAALALGYSMSAAVEFSFLLGLVTLGAATAYEALNSGSLIIEAFGVWPSVVGFVAAFASAAVAVKWMVAYLQTKSLAIFGWYRLGVAAVTAVLIFTSVIETA